MSIPFFTGIISGFLSVTCLTLAFKNELDNGSVGNPFGLPAGVRTEVRIAQYMGIIIGVVSVFFLIILLVSVEGVLTKILY